MTAQGDRCRRHLYVPEAFGSEIYIDAVSGQGLSGQVGLYA